MYTNNDKTSWLTSLLTGWGIKESWAKIIAGAIIGALCAAGLLTTACKHVTPQQLQQAHELYHATTGEPCLITTENK